MGDTEEKRRVSSQLEWMPNARLKLYFIFPSIISNQHQKKEIVIRGKDCFNLILLLLGCQADFLFFFLPVN